LRGGFAVAQPRPCACSQPALCRPCHPESFTLIWVPLLDRYLYHSPPHAPHSQLALCIGKHSAISEILQMLMAEDLSIYQTKHSKLEYIYICLFEDLSFYRQLTDRLNVEDST